LSRRIAVWLTNNQSPSSLQRAQATKQPSKRATGSGIASFRASWRVRRSDFDQTRGSIGDFAGLIRVTAAAFAEDYGEASRRRTGA
jgi:hypothetical protein